MYDFLPKTSVFIIVVNLNPQLDKYKNNFGNPRALKKDVFEIPSPWGRAGGASGSHLD